MKKYQVTVRWLMSATVEVSANNLAAAVTKVYNGGQRMDKKTQKVIQSDGSFVEDSYEIDYDKTMERHPRETIVINSPP